MSIEAEALNEHAFIATLSSAFHVPSPVLSLVLFSVIFLLGIAGIAGLVFSIRRVVHAVLARKARHVAMTSCKEQARVTRTTGPVTEAHGRCVDLEATAESSQNSTTVKGLSEEEMMEQMPLAVVDAYLRLTGRKQPVIPRGSPNIPYWPEFKWDSSLGPRPDCIELLDERCQPGCYCSTAAKAREEAEKRRAAIDAIFWPSHPSKCILPGNIGIGLQRDTRYIPTERIQFGPGYAVNTARRWGAEEERDLNDETNKGSGRWRWSTGKPGNVVWPPVMRRPYQTNAIRVSRFDPNGAAQQMQIIPELKDYRTSFWQPPVNTSRSMDVNAASHSTEASIQLMQPMQETSPRKPSITDEIDFVDVHLSPARKANRVRENAFGEELTNACHFNHNVLPPILKKDDESHTQVKRVKKHRQLRPTGFVY